VADVPLMLDISDEELAAIKADLNLPEQEVSDEAASIPIEMPKRKRGRPKGSKTRGKFDSIKSNNDPEPEERDAGTVSFPPAPLTKRDEREVASRLASILTGGTGVLGMAKPYLEMTEEEARAIADPLSSYLVRNADTMPIARQVLENYDLLAITLGVMAYVVRVYRDRSAELVEIKRRSGSTTLSRVGTATETPESGPEVREGNFVSVPFG
jgi:hypothetical protein